MIGPARGVFILALLLASGRCVAERVPAPTSIDGKWFIELNTNDIGYLRTVMTFEQDEESFDAHSHEGAASEIVGWFKLLLAKLLTHYFSHGALLHFLDGSVIPDSLHGGATLHAIFASALGDMEFSGHAIDSTLTGTLKVRGKVVGAVRGSRTIPELPLENYPSLFDRTREIADEKLFDRSIRDGAPWHDFVSRMSDGATRALDDADMIFLFFQEAGKLPFSHFFLSAQSNDSSLAFATWDTSAKTPSIRLRKLDSGTAVLRIATFSGDARPIDSCFALLHEWRDSVLIIDLRGNSGGNLSAMRVAAYLADSVFAGGAFVTRKWFESQTAPPTTSEMDQFPLLTEANVKLLFDGVHRERGVRLSIIPATPRFSGRVFVFADRFSASACEPLLYGLQQHHLATIVGERSAGAMLNGEHFPITGAWEITIPTADYYTSDGKRLDHVGVTPDVAVKSSDALTNVQEWIAHPETAPNEPRRR